ncbi:MAG TPA: glycosyltransferase family 39 protein [Terriglobales bacterium]|nr:glycosyltransferase family 39 protein [Terriglobales bacterium]
MAEDGREAAITTPGSVSPRTLIAPPGVSDAGRSSRERRSLYSMFFVALGIRLAVSAVMVPEFLDSYRDHWHFGWEMGRIARSICNGQGFSSPFFDPSGPTAMLPPVYPYLVAACMKLFGGFTVASTMAILTLNSIFASLTVLPIYFLAKRIFDERTARVSAWVWVFFPYSIYLAGGRIYSDTLTCLVAATVWLQTIRLVESRRTADWVIWGALWGIAGLISPTLLAPLPFLAMWLAVRRRQAKASWLVPGMLAALVFLAFVTPWTVRNYRAFHRLIPLRDGFWMEVHVGNSGDTSDVTPDSAHPTTSAIEYAQWRRLGEIGYMDAKKQQALEFIRLHPGFFVWMCVRHFVNTWTGFWSLDPKFLADEPFHIPNVFLTTTMTVLMLVGLRYAWRNGRAQAVLPLVLVLVTYPLVYYVTHSAMDYRHPLDPIIVILCCYGVLEWRRVPRSGKSPDLGHTTEAIQNSD